MTTVAAPRHVLGLGGLSPAVFDALLDLAAVMRRHPLAWRETLAPRAVVMTARGLSEQAVNLLGVHQAMLRALVTGDWEA